MGISHGFHDGVGSNCIEAKYDLGVSENLGTYKILQVYWEIDDFSVDLGIL